MPKPKRFKTDSIDSDPAFPPPIPEISRIVSTIEDEYRTLSESGLGSTPFDADARLATIKLLAIIADELSGIRRSPEKGQD